MSAVYAVLDSLWQHRVLIVLAGLAGGLLAATVGYLVWVRGAGAGPH